MDLAPWYAQGRWVGLLDLIDGLPSASRLNEAIVNDPEAAEHLAAQRLASKGKGGDWSPSVHEFTLEHHMLREVISQLTSLRQVMIAANGGKPKPEKPFPAPVTGIDRAIERMEREWTEDILGQFGFDSTDM